MSLIRILGSVAVLALAACSGSNVEMRSDASSFLTPALQYEDARARVTSTNVQLPYDPQSVANKPVGLFQAMHVVVTCKHGERAGAIELKPHPLYMPPGKNATTLIFTCGGQLALAVENKSPLGYRLMTYEQKGPTYEAIYYDRRGLTITAFNASAPHEVRDLLEK